jgi:hypothetical protein
MTALLSLLVCLAAQPAVCETVTPDVVRADGAQPSFFECLGSGGQEIARDWLAAHPAYVLRSVRCSIGNDAEQLRATIEQPEA